MRRMTRRQFCAAAAAMPLVARPALAAGAGPLRLVAAPARAAIATPEFGETDVWSFGDIPGPEIRVRAGERVQVLLENRLPEPTTIHWHGIRIENAMDGVPDLTQKAVQPGETFLYDFVAPDAGTFWYHSHFRSFEQVERGLYGTLVVTGDADAMRAREVVLLVDDWRLAESGLIHEASFGAPMDASHGGRLGNRLTVNGRSGPVVEARPGERLRLRMISAANARIMSFDLGGLDAWISALDGWPLDSPLPLTDPLELAPAQRADVVIDMPQGEGHVDILELSTGEPLRAATIDVKGAARSTAGGQPLLATRAGADLDLANARRIPLVMEGGAMGRMGALSHQGQPIDGREMMRLGLFWAFNGKVGKVNPAAPVAAVRIGETVVIELDNRTAWPHAMHLHGSHMQVISRDGETVSGAHWRDTILNRPGERLDLAFVANNPGKWLFHCHMLEHAASGMMTWIDVS